MKDKKILVSSCLVGIPCRYDGKSKPVPELVELYKQGKVVLACPEQEGGLKTPRVPAEIIGEKVINQAGEDVTKFYQKGAEKTLKTCLDNEIETAILKAKSPSCGTGSVYDGTFTGKLVPGNGITAQLLKENGITVINENDYLESLK